MRENRVERENVMEKDRKRSRERGEGEKGVRKRNIGRKVRKSVRK